MPDSRAEMLYRRYFDKQFEDFFLAQDIHKINAISELAVGG